MAFSYNPLLKILLFLYYDINISFVNMFINQTVTDYALLKSDSLPGEAVRWENAFALGDPGVHGVLHQFRWQGFEVPEIGYEVEDRRGMVVAQLELAWPSQRLGVAISQEDLETAQAALWNAIPVHKAVDV